MMKARIKTPLRRWLLIAAAAAFALVLGLALIYLQNDIHRNYLDPKIPFQIYRPPPAPDYRLADGWYLNPAIAGYYADPRKVDVFFIHGTSFNGHSGWLGNISSNAIKEEVQRVQLSNYAAPFAIMGNVYAPKYRQASLYTQLTLKQDAVEARQFAYGDIAAAFQRFFQRRFIFRRYFLPDAGLRQRIYDINVGNGIGYGRKLVEPPGSELKTAFAVAAA